ncbi:hypothetical protein CFELI_10915 [Corynebacterium felinum]|uniref:Uncharacterized protein n=1 Tax=Corynebacterium felinum TaxID=131318 RepID=A0ABU2B5C7_9CORY|nr:hypothetical protein [Corynebacterium felinum]WJY95781.1 hypothetical protein CFELI_10915 [Corynebacterium felinum]
MKRRRRSRHTLTHDRRDWMGKALRTTTEQHTYEYVEIDSKILIRLSANTRKIDLRFYG